MRTLSGDHFAFARRQVAHHRRAMVRFGAVVRHHQRVVQPGRDGAVAGAQGGHHRTVRVQAVGTADGVAAFILAGPDLAQLHVLRDAGQVDDRDRAWNAFDDEVDLGARLDAFQRRHLEALDAQRRRRGGRGAQPRRHVVAGGHRAVAVAQDGADLVAGIDVVAASHGVLAGVDPAVGLPQRDRLAHAADADAGAAARRAFHRESQQRARVDPVVARDLQRMHFGRSRPGDRRAWQRGERQGGRRQQAQGRHVVSQLSFHVEPPKVVLGISLKALQPRWCRAKSYPYQ